MIAFHETAAIQTHTLLIDAGMVISKVYKSIINIIFRRRILKQKFSAEFLLHVGLERTENTNSSAILGIFCVYQVNLSAEIISLFISSLNAQVNSADLKSVQNVPQILLGSA